MYKRQGYSLIELLVTMSIIGMFLAVILPGFRSHAPEKSIEQAALTVQSMIKEVRSLSYTSTAGILSYEISFSKTGGNKKVQIKSYDLNSWPTVKKETQLPDGTYVSNIAFVSSSSPFSPVFPNLGDITFSTISPSILFNNEPHPYISPDNIYIEIDNNKSSTKARIHIDPVTARSAIEIKKQEEF